MCHTWDDVAPICAEGERFVEKLK
jgi:hypothetical protein